MFDENQSLIEVNARRVDSCILTKHWNLYQSLIEVNASKIEISGYPEIVLYQSLIELNAKVNHLNSR